MATIPSLKPCLSISYTPTYTKHRHNSAYHCRPQFAYVKPYNNVTKVRNIILRKTNHNVRLPVIAAVPLDDRITWTTTIDPHHCRHHPDVDRGFSSMESFYMSYNVMGSYGSSSAVTLERPKPELDSKLNKLTSREASNVEFDRNNDDGNNNGNGKVGGGDNGGGGFNDDDDYFEDFDDDDDEGNQEGFFTKRVPIQELFDKVFIDAVLSEWQKTLMDLPVGMRQACELGLMSSAQLVRYLMNEARPTFTRAIYRALNEDMSRGFIGRVTADPAFLHKLVFEQLFTIACSVWSEFKTREERMKEEWGLAFVNVATAVACNLVVVWSLAPCYTYGRTTSDLKNALHKLPNNVFEHGYRGRKFDLQKRFQSFIHKAIQLSLVGFTAGALQSAFMHLCAKQKETRLSTQMPPTNKNALGSGAFLGLYTNCRYQMVYGMDRLLNSHFNVVQLSLGLAVVLRLLNAQLGEYSRTMWFNTEKLAPLPQAQSNKTQKKRRIIRKKNQLQNCSIANKCLV